MKQRKWYDNSSLPPNASESAESWMKLSAFAIVATVFLVFVYYAMSAVAPEATGKEMEKLSWYAYYIGILIVAGVAVAFVYEIVVGAKADYIESKWVEHEGGQVSVFHRNLFASTFHKARNDLGKHLVDKDEEKYFN